MRHDVAKYMKYYNVERLHWANFDQSPIEFESSFIECPVELDQSKLDVFWRPLFICKKSDSLSRQIDALVKRPPEKLISV